MTVWLPPHIKGRDDVLQAGSVSAGRQALPQLRGKGLGMKGPIITPTEFVSKKCREGRHHECCSLKCGHPYHSYGQVIRHG